MQLPLSTIYNQRHGQSGNAALEVLLLLPFILLIFMLLFNMGYNADRRNKTQAALRIGGFHYVAGLATMTAEQSRDATTSLVNSQIFPGETSAVTLTYSDDPNMPPCPHPEQQANQGQQPECFEDTEGLLGKASFRITVRADVNRSAPYPSLVNNDNMSASYVVSSNTWTFCELRDEDFEGAGSAALNGGALVGDYLLWLFGGCGGGIIGGCEDRCPK